MKDTTSALDAAPASSRWALLAGTRFILAFIVLAGHLQSFGLPFGPITKIAIALNQGSAVYGFLIISGYSIAASLERSSSGFYVRRFWRIFPTYIASIALALIASYFIVGSVSTPNGTLFYPAATTGVVIALLMLQSFVGPTISPDGQLWTLAVEWWNYMLAPFFKKAPLAIMFALVTISLAANKLLPPSPRPDTVSGGRMFLDLSWYWIIGFLYFRFRRTPIGYAILFFPIVIAYNEFWVGRAAVIGLMGVAICDEISLPQWSLKSLNWLGELSYPVYAVHIPVIILFMVFHYYNGGIILLAALATSVAVLHGMDLPLRKWGSAISSRKRRT